MCTIFNVHLHFFQASKSHHSSILVPAPGDLFRMLNLELQESPHINKFTFIQPYILFPWISLYYPASSRSIPMPYSCQFIFSRSCCYFNESLLFLSRIITYPYSGYETWPYSLVLHPEGKVEIDLEVGRYWFARNMSVEGSQARRGNYPPERVTGPFLLAQKIQGEI